jgi:hypothetical protein
MHTRLKFFGYTNMLPFPAPQLVEMPVAFLIVFGVVGLLILRYARQSSHILAAHPAMLAFLIGSIGAGFVGSVDNERCAMFAAIPVLYVFARLIVAHADVHGNAWAVTVLVGMQVYLSGVFTTDVTNFPSYMSHFMRPETTVRYAVTWATAAVLLEVVRWWGASRQPAPD